MPDDSEQPQIYLISPSEVAPSTFPDDLSRLLDTVEIACVRLALSTRDEDQLMRIGDLVREVAHARDVPVVLAEHMNLAERLGLDGVHLSDGSRSVRAARKLFGPDAIVGSYCGASRHDGMTAGEAGADYVSFGPVRETALGDGTVAGHDLFAWWSQMIEVPIVAEGALDLEAITALAPVADFLAVGPEIWEADSPLEALQTLIAPLG